MNESRALTKIFSIALVIFIITSSIALPIFIRPFYYMHIDALSLPETLLLSRNEIKEAYDEVLDYLTIPGKDFKTGIFPHSEIGYDHFRDCKALFFISNSLLFISLAAIIIILALEGKGKIELERKNKRHISQTVAKRLLIGFAIAALLISVSFKTAFDLFHKIFFPGKDNWKMSYKTDPFVLVLPEEFFRNCAILIFVSIVIQCVVIMLLNRKKKSPR